MAESIEVFRDLYLRGPVARRSDLRQALVAAAVDPWYYDPDRSAAISRNVTDTDADILAFGRKASDDLQAAELTLWSRDDGYYVPNIVPIEFGELSIAQYNDILTDFLERVVRPVAPQFDYQIDATAARQDLGDWTSADAARKLRAFSAAANKSTGASHPLDQRRWFDFIIAVHESQKTIGTDHLVRWLYKVDGWDEESAHKLAGQYETALSLLKRYDER
ncbi:MAG TPA: hypothetical protein VM689_07375 [Aliidongia sp.]|nr:hypothetical protein [Aliidongia sp.]